MGKKERLDTLQFSSKRGDKSECSSTSVLKKERKDSDKVKHNTNTPLPSPLTHTHSPGGERCGKRKR